MNFGWLLSPVFVTGRSDQLMVWGRTTAPAGMVLGHEITGEVIEKGRDVEYLEIGDLVCSARAYNYRKRVLTVNTIRHLQLCYQPLR
jgi:D-arabinose 1-dehydrogenase-like Zn-dependent alcohol dehydrogenase